MTNVNKWSTTAASNSNSDSPINWAENQAPSTVNDSARAMMAAVAADRDDTRGFETFGGGTTAYTFSSTSTNTTYQNGMEISAKMPSAPTGAMTINVDAIGARKAYDASLTQIAAGGLASGQHTKWQYNSTLDGGTGGFVLVSASTPIVKYAFSAHKNGTNQTGIASSVATKITFTTEAFDVGSYYDAANSKWTPPAGMVCLTAHCLGTTTNMSDNATQAVYIYKNGAAIRQTSCPQPGTANPLGNYISTIDQANGTDYYEVYWLGNGGGSNRTVDGSIIATYFQGWFL
jgi:hypothetical protein